MVREAVPTFWHTSLLWTQAHCFSFYSSRSPALTGRSESPLVVPNLLMPSYSAAMSGWYGSALQGGVTAMLLLISELDNFQMVSSILTCTHNWRYFYRAQSRNVARTAHACKTRITLQFTIWGFFREFMTSDSGWCCCDQETPKKMSNLMSREYRRHTWY